MTTHLDATPQSVSREVPSGRAPGLFDARPSNDVTLTVVKHPPHSANAPAIAPRVGPVRTEFRAPWVRVTPTTCAECGEKDALVKISRDGKEFPACVGCWRADRRAVPEPPPQLAARRDAIAFDDAVLATLQRLGPSTIAQVATAQLGDDLDTGSGAGRAAYVAVRDSVYRLEGEGEVRRLRSRGRRRVRFRVVIT